MTFIKIKLIEMKIWLLIMSSWKIHGPWETHRSAQLDNFSITTIINSAKNMSDLFG